MKKAEMCLLENNHTEFAHATAQVPHTLSVESCLALNLEL